MKLLFNCLLSVSLVLLAKSSYATNVSFSPQVSAGYSLNQCYSNSNLVKISCANTTKFNLGLNIGAKNNNENIESKSDTGNHIHLHNYNYWNLKFDRLEDFIILVGFFVVIFIFYGIFATIAGVYSSDLTFGAFYSRDIVNSKNSDALVDYELNHIDKFGVNVGFYFGYTNFLMKLSTAYSKANFQNNKTTHSLAKLDSEGISSSIALGWMPRPKDQGIHVFYEFEGSIYQGGSLIKHAKNKFEAESYNLKNTSHALVLGYGF